MTFRLDHVVVVVPELARAVGEFERAGFVVIPGGRHDALPTENALIGFPDGAYLELLAVRDDDAREALRIRAARPGWSAELRRGSAIARRFLPNLLGPLGVADFVLVGEDIARAGSEMRRRGFPMTGPVPMSRTRPDGVALEWDLVLPDAARLPFFIEDRTPREWRAPLDPRALAHPNGTRGVGEVTVRVPQVPQAALDYADLFQVRPRPAPGERAAFEMAGVTIVLEPGEREGAVAAGLRGAGTLPAEVEALGLRFLGDVR